MKMNESPERQLRAVVVANGDFPHTDRLLAIVDSADLVVAADGGANWLVDHQRLPDILLGDLDSARPEVVAALAAGRCRLLRLPAHKDETDTELALLEAAQQGASQITLLGALGGRSDHALANVLLLAMPPLAAIDARIFDGTSYLWVMRSTTTVAGSAGDLVSLIPLAGDALGVVTEGMGYPLRDETLRFGLARGISNVLVEPTGRVHLRQGLLLVVHTPARHLEG